ncbi:MAG: CAP domain-containing protein [Myxococcota bacterium]
MRTFISILLLVPTLAFAQSAPAVDADGEAAMLERINVLRTENNLSPLTRHSGLDAAARAHSIDMATFRELVHVSARTGDPGRRVQEAGVSTTRIAENIARHGTTLGAHESILGSDAHRAQLLDESFTHIGLAAVSGPDGIYVTQVMAALAAPPAPALPPPSVEDVAPTPEPETVNPPITDPPPAPAAPVAPAAPQAAPVPAAPQAAAVPAQPATPSMRMPRSHRRVAGYWIHQGGRWWYFPVPPRAVPGQILHPDPNVQGPPPGYRPQATRRPLVRPAQPPPVRYRTRPARPGQPTVYWY